MDQHKLNEVNELMARNQVEGPDDPVSGESTEDRAETAESTVVNEAETTNAPTPKPPVQAGESALGTYRKNARKFALLGVGGCVLGLAALEAAQFRPHADGKGDDAYLERAEGEEVSEFMKEDEAAEHQHHGQRGVPVGKIME